MNLKQISQKWLSYILSNYKILLSTFFWLLCIFFSIKIVTSPNESISFLEKILPGIMMISFVLSLLKIWKTTTVRFDWVNYFEDFSEKSTLDSFLIFNKNLIFPAILIIYLSSLVVKKTQFINLQLNPFFLVLEENFLMIVIIISWFFLGYSDWSNDNYYQIDSSVAHTYRIVIISIILSITSWIILLQQLVDIGQLWLGIVNIFMVLVFLIWLIILKEA